MKLMMSAGFSVAAFLIAGCAGSTSPVAGSSLTAGASAIRTMQTKMNDVGNLLVNPASFTMTEATEDAPITVQSAFGSNWSGTAVMSDPRADGSGCHSSPVTFKDWMGYEFDESAVRCNGSAINVFGRVKNVIGIACIVFNSVTAATSSDLPTSGSSDLVFDAATRARMASDCGMTLPSSDFTVNITYAMPSSSTTYDRKITFVLPAALGGGSSLFYIRYNATNAAISTSESNSNGTSRTIAMYNFTTRVLLGEYISRAATGPNPVYVHRLYKDEASDTARIHSYITDNTNSVRYVLTGKPAAATDLALSAKVTGYGFGAPVTSEACVNSSTGNITADGPTVTANAFTCGAVNGKTEAAATGSASVKTSVDGAVGTWWDISAAPPVLSWSTIDNMLTSGL
jgi:hypothetical protein